MRLGPFDVPVDPDAPEARQWLNDELAKPAYEASRPSWFDQVSKGFADWVGSLFHPGAGLDGWLPVVIAVVATVVVAGVIVVSILLFGLPRRNRRASASSELFGADDERSARELRQASVAAAREGDADAAIADRFRAIARDLSDRSVVVVLPGTTADHVGREAAVAFPARADALSDAAAVFDAVRYLGRAGTLEQYERLRALDDELAASRPVEFADAER